MTLFVKAFTYKVVPFVRDLCKFKTVEFIPISGYKGVNLVEGEKNLIDTLIQFSSIKREEKAEIKRLEPFNIFSADVTIIHTETLISPGYKFMIHYTGEEYEVEVLKMSVPLVKGKAICKMIFKSEKLIYPEYNSERFIMRTCNTTCGYGKITSAKNGCKN